MLRATSRPPTGRIAAASLLILTSLTATSCYRLPQSETLNTESLFDVPGEDELRDRVDAVLHAVFDRRLNLEEHATWQILHGVLAFERDFLVEETSGGARIPAIAHLLNGGRMNNWETEPGIELDAESGRRGLRVLLDRGSGTGQGHPDQWLAVMAQAELDKDEEIHVDGRIYRMVDWLDQTLWDAPRNVEREYSWTLIGVTHYLPTSHSWIASDGREWNVEQLVEEELMQELETSACGGTHRMIGLAMALNRHLDDGGRLDGIWGDVQFAVEDAVAAARENQSPDGSFSIHYFSRPGNSPDLQQNLGSTGHVLEFLMFALDDQQLREPWVTRAVMNLCGLFEFTRDEPLECGALYHAAHALVVYRERMFGACSYADR